MFVDKLSVSEFSGCQIFYFVPSVPNCPGIIWSSYLIYWGQTRSQPNQSSLLTCPTDHKRHPAVLGAMENYSALTKYFFVNFTVGAVNRRAIKIDPALVSLQADHQNHLWFCRIILQSLWGTKGRCTFTNIFFYVLLEMQKGRNQKYHVIVKRSKKMYRVIWNSCNQKCHVILRCS